MATAETRLLTPPLAATDVKGLRAGDRVRFSGVLLTARDAAHQRLVARIDAGQPLPIDLHGQVLYYVGPTPPRPGMVIGAAGPTTGGRMGRLRLQTDGPWAQGNDRERQPLSCRTRGDAAAHLRLLRRGRWGRGAPVQTHPECGGCGLRGFGHGSRSTSDCRGFPRYRHQRCVWK